METLKLLVFVGTEGIYHDHAGNGQFLTSMLNDTDEIASDFSQDYDVLADGLSGYDTVLFYTDVGELSAAQETGLLNYIRAGGGFFGLHTAAASFRESEGYHGMLNGFFDGHSPYMDFTVNVSDSGHPITEGLADFGVTDELYYLKHNPDTSHHLMHAYDETKDETHVMAFHHLYGEGRVFTSRSDTIWRYLKIRVSKRLSDAGRCGRVIDFEKQCWIGAEIRSWFSRSMLARLDEV